MAVSFTVTFMKTLWTAVAPACDILDPLWIWRFSTLRATDSKWKQHLPQWVSLAETKERWEKTKWHCFHPVRKGYEYDASWSRHLSCLVWKSFHRLLHSAGNWNGEIVNGCSNSSKDDAQWSVIRLGSCLMWMCEKTSVPVHWLQFGTANQGCYTPAR